MSVVSIPGRPIDFPPTRPQQHQQHHQGGGVGQGSMSQPSADQIQLHQTLDRMALYVRKTRLQIQPFFADFDKHKQGAISWAQFARVLATVGFSGLTHEIVENLSRHYSLPNDPTKVSFKSFISDVESIAHAQQEAQYEHMQRTTAGPTLDFQESQSRNPLVKRDDPNNRVGGVSASARAPFQKLDDIHAEAPLTAEKILHKIQTVCQQKRILLHDIFQDFDGLRKNVITLQRFRRCLDVAGFQLSDSEANVFILKYLNANDPNMVDYKRFIADVLAPFIPARPETQPLGYLGSFEPYRLEDQETPQPHFSEDELDRVEYLLKELGYQTHTRRILIKPGFQHHDHTNSGCITARQFASVLTSTFPTVRFQAPRDLDLLCAKYRRANYGIHYPSFLRDVEHYEINASEYAKTLHPSHAASHLAATMGPQAATMERVRLNQGPTLVAGMRVLSAEEQEQARLRDTTLPGEDASADVLVRVREQLKRVRMNIEDVFKDFDPLNKGRVTAPQFARCLNVVNIKLSPADILVLREKYTNRDENTHVDYKRFTADLSEIPRF